MEFAEMVEAYLRLGVLGLIAVVLVFVFILLVKKLLSSSESKDTAIQNQLEAFMKLTTEQNNKLFEHMQESNNKLLNEVVHKVVNHIPTPEENDQLTKISDHVNKVLQEILNRSESSRACLIQFHNGGRGINRHSFLKMSMTNEAVCYGAKSFISEFKEQFRSVLAYFVKEIQDNGKCYIVDRDNIKNEDYSMYEYMINKNIESLFGIAIYGSSSEVIAILCIEFEKKDNVNIKKVDSVLSEKQDTIQTLLNLKI